MKWTPSWSYLPIEYNVDLGIIENETQRLVVANNLNGSKVRLKLSNRYSTEELILHRVTVGLQNEENDQIMSITNVTRDKKERIVLAPGEECYSDEISLEITSKNKLVISIYVKEKTTIRTVCSTWSSDMMKVLNSDHGDYTKEQSFLVKSQEDLYEIVKKDPTNPKGRFVYGVTEIQVMTNDKVKIIVAFGDSITHMSFWTEPLAKRLYEVYPGEVTLINRGIGGNRLLRDPLKLSQIPGDAKCFGKAGIMRFEDDVYGEYNPNSVILLEGINDIMHPYQFKHTNEVVTSKELKEGYCKIRDIAKRYGSKVFIGTVTPCGSTDNLWLTEIEEVRQTFNQWIRENALFDGYIDFDLAVRDNNNPGWMEENNHLGDGLHPNHIGGEKMAQAVCIEQFMQ